MDTNATLIKKCGHAEMCTVICIAREGGKLLSDNRMILPETSVLSTTNAKPMEVLTNDWTVRYLWHRSIWRNFACRSFN